MSSFFKKAGSAIGGLFKKHPSGAIVKAFSKGGQIARGLSSGLSTASKVLGQVGKVGGQILNDPTVREIGMATAPELYLGAQGLARGASGLSKVAGLGSNLVNPDSYKKASSVKGHLENLADAKKRFDATKEASNSVSFA